MSSCSNLSTLKCPRMPLNTTLCFTNKQIWLGDSTDTYFCNVIKLFFLPSVFIQAKSWKVIICCSRTCSFLWSARRHDDAIVIFSLVFRYSVKAELRQHYSIDNNMSDAFVTRLQKPLVILLFNIDKRD